MYILNPPATNLFTAITAIVAESFSETAIEFSFNTSLPTFNFRIECTGKEFPARGEVKEFATRLAERPAIEATRVEVYRRGPSQTSLRLVYEVSNGVGRFEFRDTEAQAPVATAFDSLAKHLPLITQAAAVIGKGDIANQKSIQFQHASVSQLEAQVSKLGTFLTEQIERQTRHAETLERQYQEQLRSKAQDLEASTAKEREQLDAERKAHAARVAGFETDEARYVRRKLMAEARTEASRAKKIISPETQRKRWWIHAVFLAVLGLAGTGAYAYVRRVLSSQEFDWHYAVGAAACSITLVSFAIYYLRWNDQWASDHAQLEFSNHRFNLDLLRASWLAELLFDWDQEKKSPFPPELISAFGHNLFRPHGVKQAEHPIEQLAGMMGDVNKLKLGRTGVELEKIRATADVQPAKK